MKAALIAGVSGEDGARLARFLLAQGLTFGNLRRLGIDERARCATMVPATCGTSWRASTRPAPAEGFGDPRGVAADEMTPLHPRSPHAGATASVSWLLENYREAYTLYACNGILFDHESELRLERFVTLKIAAARRPPRRHGRHRDAAARVAGHRARRGLGPPSASQDGPQGFVVATGVDVVRGMSGEIA